MKEFFIVYNDSAILNRLLEFPATLIWTEMHIFMYFWTSNSCRNNDTPPIANITMPYMIDDVMKIKLDDVTQVHAQFVLWFINQ